MTRRRLAALALCAVLAGCQPSPTPHPAGPAPGGASPASAQRITTLLSQLRTVPARVHRDGYQRGCGRGQACTFGPAWSDDTDAPWGHDGCGTRDQVLAAALSDVRYRVGSRCVVVAGTLYDPYTGDVVRFTKAHASAVQIDHVLPLALGYDLGAWQWSPQRRAAFANDPRELIAAGGTVNEAKGDQSLAEWLPPATGYRCTYVTRFLTAAQLYGLPITAADHTAAQHVAAHNC